MLIVEAAAKSFDHNVTGKQGDKKPECKSDSYF